MEFFRANPFFVPFITAFVVELCKFCIDSYKARKCSFRHLFHSGGMPSGHSALVGSLLWMVYDLLGAHSVEFAITFTIGLIILYDAANIRKQAGLHAQILNTLQKQTQLETRLGHNIYQIIVGLFVGILISYMLLTY